MDRVPARSAALLLTPGRDVRSPTARTVSGAARSSGLGGGEVVVQADLHNHTLFSDGAGEPAEAFASMRAAGLDVAALTDHATLVAPWLAAAARGEAGLPPGVRPARGMHPSAWPRAAELADDADEPGSFVAIRGFEWTAPTLGHINVWFSESYTEVEHPHQVGPFFAWFTGDLAQGSLAGFNHPGREPGRFEDFAFVPAARDRLVSLEMFNRYDDYLFEGVRDGRPSPLSACLDAGWRPGLSGVTDEHGDDWGFPEGKGRAGLWVREHSRAGVREALAARRFYATCVSGLRVDATANGVRMGSVLTHRAGPVRFRVDVDRGASWEGRPLQVQVLRPGGEVPEVVEVLECRSGEVVEVVVDLALDDGPWVVLRIADPAGTNTTPGPVGHAANNRGVAYTSPWFLEPGEPGEPGHRADAG